MAWKDILGSLVNIVVGSAKAGAEVAKDTGIATSITVSGTTVSMASIVSALSTLESADIGGDLQKSDFSSLKSFLESQQLVDMVVDVGSIMSLVGLFVPAVAVAANDIKALATVLTLIHKFAPTIAKLNLFADLVPVNGGAGGYVSKEWAADPRMKYDPKTGRFLE